MRDFTQDISAVDQRATGSITYGAPVGAEYARGVVTVVDWEKCKEAKAAGSITFGNPVSAIKAAGTITYGAPSAGAKASQTITYGVPVAGDHITVNGNSFTCVTANPDANEFTDIASLTALIAALPDITATADATTITVVAEAYGAEANAYTLALGAGNTGTMAVGGATLAGGVHADTVSVAGTSFTCVAAAPGANEFSDITELTALVTALATVNATDNGTVVAVVAAAFGTDGNAITLGLGGSNAGTMDISGANLTGGRNGDTVIVNGNTFTHVNAGAGAGEFTNIAGLESLVEAVSGLDSTQDGTTVSITASANGTAGNAITIALGASNAGDMAISGATLTGGQDNLTITVNGSALVQGTNFTAETSNDATATNIATAIDGLANINASAESAVVTIVADARGVAGNAYTTVTSNAAAATVAGATFTGGVAGDTVVVDGTTCTCVVGTAGANEFSDITELEALVEAISGIDSTVASGVITIKATAAGAAGNAKTLALGEDNAGTMTVSGATLTGGADYGSSEVFHMLGHTRCDIFVDVSALSAGTLDITPQISGDGVNWIDAVGETGSAITFTQISGASHQLKRLPIVGNHVRCKLDLGGTNPIPTGTITFIATGN